MNSTETRQGFLPRISTMTTMSSQDPRDVDRLPKTTIRDGRRTKAQRKILSMWRSLVPTPQERSKCDWKRILLFVFV